MRGAAGERIETCLTIDTSLGMSTPGARSAAARSRARKGSAARVRGPETAARTAAGRRGRASRRASRGADPSAHGREAPERADRGRKDPASTGRIRPAPDQVAREVVPGRAARDQVARRGARSIATTKPGPEPPGASGSPTPLGRLVRRGPSVTSALAPTSVVRARQGRPRESLAPNSTARDPTSAPRARTGRGATSKAPAPHSAARARELPVPDRSAADSASGSATPVPNPVAQPARRVTATRMSFRPRQPASRRASSPNRGRPPSRPPHACLARRTRTTAPVQAATLAAARSRRGRPRRPAGSGRPPRCPPPTSSATKRS
jgi:hypothetical protein